MNSAKWRRRVAVQMARHGTSILIHWQERTGTADAVTGAPAAEPIQKSEPVKGFVHFAEAKSELRQFDEIATGDCIIDIPCSVALEGRAELVFEIDGTLYEQKRLSGKLAQAWDAMYGQHGILRTILLGLKQ